LLRISFHLDTELLQGQAVDLFVPGQFSQQIARNDQRLFNRNASTEKQLDFFCLARYFLISD